MKFDYVLFKTKRQEAGMTVDDLAEISTVSVQQIHKIEDGRATPRVRTIEKLSFALSEPMELFMAEDSGPLGPPVAAPDPHSAGEATGPAPEADQPDGLHPALAALVAALPPPADGFPRARQKVFIKAIRSTLALVYGE